MFFYSSKLISLSFILKGAIQQVAAAGAPTFFSNQPGLNLSLPPPPHSQPLGLAPQPASKASQYNPSQQLSPQNTPVSEILLIKKLFASFEQNFKSC